jgi:hypothetical protein
MNNEINMEDLNTYFEDPTYTPEEEQMLSDGFLEEKVYHGIITERKPTLTTNPDKITGKKMPMLLYKINFQIENNREKLFTYTIVFYPKDHRYHGMTVENKEKFQKATGVNAKNAFADEHAFIGKEVDATLKKDGKYTVINFVEKGVIGDMKQHGQHIPDGKAERFDDDIPF